MKRKKNLGRPIPGIDFPKPVLKSAKMLDAEKVVSLAAKETRRAAKRAAPSPTAKIQYAKRRRRGSNSSRIQVNSERAAVYRYMKAQLDGMSD